MAKHTKAIKIYLHKPLNATWDELGKRLNDLEYQFAKIMNFGMTQFWLWQSEKEQIKETTGKYPTLKELPHPTNDNSRPVKMFIKKNFKDFPSYCVSNITQELKNKWSSDCKDVFYYNKKSLSTFKKGYPILCGNDQFNIKFKKDFGYVLTITLANKNYKGVRRYEIQLKTKRMNNSQKIILDRMISKEYKQGQLKLIKDKRKKAWYVAIAYSFESVEYNLDKNIICGIDLGVAIPFYAAITNSKERLYPTDGQEIYNFKYQIDNRRKSVQKQLNFSNRGGRGRKCALKPLEKLQKKVDNFRDSKYHLYTKRIIEFCIKNNSGIIQLEDLSGLMKKKQTNSFLSKWAIHSFYEKLEYKAKEAGIEIIKVDPRYTSQRCSKCGHISKDNRKTQSEFECVSCGNKLNADYNAACNLAIDKIDDIITNQLEKIKK